MNGILERIASADVTDAPVSVPASDERTPATVTIRTTAAGPYWTATWECLHARGPMASLPAKPWRHWFEHPDCRCLAAPIYLFPTPEDRRLWVADHDVAIDLPPDDLCDCRPSFGLKFLPRLTMAMTVHGVACS